MAITTIGSYIFDNDTTTTNNTYSSSTIGGAANKVIYDIVGTNTFDFTGLSYSSVDVLGNWLVAKDASGAKTTIALTDTSVLKVGSSAYALKTVADFKVALGIKETTSNTSTGGSTNNGGTTTPTTKTINLKDVTTAQGDKATVETFVFGTGTGTDSVKLSTGDKLSVGSIKVMDKTAVSALTAVPTDATYALYTPAADNSSATLSIIDKFSKHPITKKVSASVSKTDVVTLTTESDVKLVGTATDFDKGFVTHA